MPSDFLPPDPYADLPLAQRPSGHEPTTPPGTPPPSGQKSNRAVAALALGCAGLGLLVFSIGALFLITLPASVAGWVLGRQAQHAGIKRDQANAAVTIGAIGTILGVIAAVAWILISSLTDWTLSGRHD